MVGAPAAAAYQLGGERVQALVPEPPEVLQPRVDLAERCGIDRVQPAGADRPYAGEAVIAQHPQMLTPAARGV